MAADGMSARSFLVCLTLMVSGSALVSAHAADPSALLRVLQERSCKQCQLQDADLVHADLRDADLRGAKLQRANLGQARLDGADLNGADLSFTSLRGASLRGANLLGARLYGTDLRESDLSGAKLNPQALEEAHWDQAKGIDNGIQSHASLHNAGVDAALQGRWSEAEALFSRAIHHAPDQSLSWVARGIARSQLVKDDLAAADFGYAATIYQSQGNHDWAKQLSSAADTLKKRRHHQDSPTPANGMGSNVLSSITSAITTLAPLAIKAFSPMGLGF